VIKVVRRIANLAASEWVDDRLEEVLPVIDTDIAEGAIVTVEDSRIRTRRPPID
jgi:hypothetical protein